MAYNPKDFYFKKAKKENFVARSVYKLQEIDQRFHVFRPGQQVLDLGAAPGSWSQYASSRISSKGKGLGIDLTQVNLALPGFEFLQADLRDVLLQSEFAQRGLHPLFDVVLSDMAPKTTGIKLTDQARSKELCDLALEVAKRHLKEGGSFVCKFFHGEDFKIFQNDLRQVFARVEVVKPDSTRAISKEIFFVGLKKR